jgi:hypothetical protein
LHAWQLLDEVRDPFGAGSIYRDVLCECGRLLERGAAVDLAGAGGCLACDARAESAGRYVDVLTEHLEGELEAPLARAGGLCWPHFGGGVARAGRGLAALARAQRQAIALVGAGRVPSGRGARSAGRPRLPAPGVRAGSAAPRRAPDEQAADPLVALALGLPGVHGLAIDRLEARAWGDAWPAGADRPSAAPEPPAPGPVDAAAAAAGRDCRICQVALLAVERAAGRLLEEAEAPTELCAPHGWLLLERGAAEAVAARLRPGLELLAERIDAAGPELARAAPLSLGPISLATPAARRARGDLAVRLAPGRGCALCQAQVGAEEAALREEWEDGSLCRPHHLVAARVGAPIRPEATLSHWRAVVAELEEYIRKNDYRFRDEPRGPEQHSPWRATAAVAGARGVR